MRRYLVAALALASMTAVLIANFHGISIGDDGVGYRAIADSLMHGRGYGYFLEDPVTVWPPVWPALLALVAAVTPFSTVGAAIVLNAVVSAGVVIVGNRLLSRLVADRRFVLAGTVVLALGPATIGLGHVLMTDMAFALITISWMLMLERYYRSGALIDLIPATALVWLGFGTRYVGLVLIAVGGLWILLNQRQRLPERIRNGVLYGIVSSAIPALWMLRNHAIDGTFTGERHSSARGLIDNGFDLAATIGRFLVPGVGNGYTYLWAAVGVIVTAGALCFIWWLTQTDVKQPAKHLLLSLGTPLGLVGMFAVLYLTYMLYVRTTTALNQLDLRLLFPAYFPLIVVAASLADRASRRGDGVRRIWPTRLVFGWAAVNVIVGLVGMVGFALGASYFVGDYADDVFAVIRENPALDSVPSDCAVYSNLPNGLYPRLESKWSPQRTALESKDPKDDLQQLESSSTKAESCLVWIDEDPTYGHLWTLDQLKARLELRLLARHGDISVFKIAPRD